MLGTLFYALNIEAYNLPKCIRAERVSLEFENRVTHSNQDSQLITAESSAI